MIFTKELEKLQHQKVYKRRCSNCLHSGHTRSHCENSKAKKSSIRKYKAWKLKRHKGKKDFKEKKKQANVKYYKKN